MKEMSGNWRVVVLDGLCRSWEVAVLQRVAGGRLGCKGEVHIVWGRE